MQLRDLECPNCGASDMETTQDGQLHCQFCDSSFGEITRICPQCGHYNEDEVHYCAQCGAQIVRDCPACGTDNWILADHCIQCGRDLDMIEQMTQRWQQSTRQRMEQRRAGLAELREQEERASQERMAGFLEAERNRQEALAKARESQQQRDCQVYVYLLVALGVFVVLVIVMLLLTVGGR